MMLGMSYGYFKPSSAIEHLIILGVSIPLSIFVGIPMSPESTVLTGSEESK